MGWFYGGKPGSGWALEIMASRSEALRRRGQAQEIKPACLQSLGCWAILWSVVAYILIIPSLSWGHADGLSVAPSTRDSPPALVAENPFPARSYPVSSVESVWVVLLTLGLSVVLACGFARRRRHTIVLGLALLISLFVFDTALHSVHHLFEPAKASQCLGFSTSQHLSGTLTAWALQTPGVALELPPPVNLALPLLTPRCRPDQSRAPPSYVV